MARGEEEQEGAVRRRRAALQRGSEIGSDALHLCVLCGFALAQPLFDLLSRNVEFFVAHRSDPVDILLFIGMLCLGLPAAVIVVEIIARLFGRRVQRGIHGAAVACFTAVIALQFLKPLESLPGTLLLGGALLVGATTAFGYVRWRPVQTFLTVLSPAALFFPALFLFHSPVHKLAFPRHELATGAAQVNATAPVVMVVFDELPVTSLMDERREIDPIRYPNFAALAQGATWFRNATTVSSSTTVAVPVILSGVYPDKPRLPTLADYPHNLFTLLNGAYELHVLESHTMLSPTTMPDDGQPESLGRRLQSLLTDVSVVYLHLVLPRSLSVSLPPVTQTWKNFLGEDQGSVDEGPTLADVKHMARTRYKDRPGIFESWVNAIAVTEKPALHFIHILLPHVPWEYLQSGKKYTRTDGMRVPGLDFKTEMWGKSSWLVVQGYQRHLLQVAFVDTLLGKLMTRLKTIGLYDRSLIIVTADHGVSFRPNDSRRLVSEMNFSDLMSVPLFIKAPHQHEGVINDRNVESIDILPTVADIVGVPLPWPIDGQSAVDPAVPERRQKLIFSGKKKFVYDAAALEGKYVTLEKKLALFGSGKTPGGLFKVSPCRELIGRRLSDTSLVGKTGGKVDLDQAALFADVDPQKDFVPAYITGRVREHSGVDPSLNLAIAINGTIRAVTQPWELPPGQPLRWSALVDEHAFQPGRNEVEVFFVSATEEKTDLAAHCDKQP